MGFDLIVDPKFRDKIPPLSDAEFKQLEENILEAGEIYEPIRTWNNVIVDGHNRYKIAQMHPEIKWTVREMNFTNEWEAYDWMYRNQLGRRNLTDEQRMYMVGKMYEARKNSRGGDRKSKSQNGALKNGKTSVAIAKELGVGQKTVERAEKFAKGIDALQEISPEAANKVLSGKAKVKNTAPSGNIIETKPLKSQIAAIADTPLELRQEVARAIENGEKLPPMTKQPNQQQNQLCHTTESKHPQSNYGYNDDNGSSEYNFKDYIDEHKENGLDFVSNLRLLKSMRFSIFDNKQNRKTMCSVIDEIKSTLDKLKEEYKNGN